MHKTQTVTPVNHAINYFCALFHDNVHLEDLALDYQ